MAPEHRLRGENAETTPEFEDRTPVPAHERSSIWRSALATRFKMIVDAEDYFSAVRQAFLQARSRIMLVGWDFDARVVLSGNGRLPDEPATIGEFLYWLIERRSGLQLYLLRWDVGALKALLRGSKPLTILKWMLHPRIHTKLDGHHPTGGSHHQKIVSIDDCLAFCGGIDVTSGRWDTRHHRDDEADRHHPNGRLYGPWHDATTAISGPAAATLAELCRDRWLIATGQRLDPIADAGPCWPDGLEPDIRNVSVSIARTVPEMADQRPTREIERMFIEQIGSARRSVYIESRYFASRRIAEAIARRLQDEDGPEFVIINPTSAEGWLQALAMDTARARLMKALRSIDRHGRLVMYHPYTAKGTPIYVHAKVMVIDDRVIRVGSANINNRSMGLDTECDVAVDAADNDPKAVAVAATRLRDGLLAEHLGCPIEAVQASLASGSALIETIEGLRGSGKSLRPYELPELATSTKWLADNELLDPEGPDEMFEPIGKRGLFRGRLGRRDLYRAANPTH